MLTSRLSSKNQVTLPREVRRALGLKPGDRVAYELHDGVVHLARMEAFDAAFHEALSETLDEWTTPADEQAFRDL